MDTRRIAILQTGNEKALCLMNEDTTGDVATFYKEQSERHIKTIVDRANAFPSLVQALGDTLRVLVTPSGLPDVGKGRTQEQQAAYDQARNLLDNLTR